MPGAIGRRSRGLDNPAVGDPHLPAAREAAHHWFFSHVPWLSGQLARRGRGLRQGMKVDMSGMEQLASGISRLPMDRRRWKSFPQGCSSPRPPGADGRAGAPGDAAGADRGLCRRWSPTPSVTGSRGRRASGDAAAATGDGWGRLSRPATLVGLELRPRKMREAAVLWERLTEAAGIDAATRVAAPGSFAVPADLDDGPASSSTG